MRGPGVGGFWSDADENPVDSLVLARIVAEEPVRLVKGLLTRPGLPARPGLPLTALESSWPLTRASTRLSGVVRDPAAGRAGNCKPRAPPEGFFAAASEKKPRLLAGLV